jgi:sugar fermentation stimulation protein A
MRFQTPLIPARLIRRYKRFLADIELEDGSQVTAHCPNPGSMLGLSQPGTKIWVEPNDDPRKKLKYGWQLVDHENGHFTGINTGAANKIVKEALIARQIKGLDTYNNCLPEVKYGENSRIDFLLTGSSDSAPGTYLEVKSVTLMRQSGLAEFPDSVTDRGLKHLGDLFKIAKLGKRAVLLFLVQRSDCAAFDVASDIDPAYGKAYRGFKKQDIEVMVYSCDLSPDAIRIDKKLLI